MAKLKETILQQMAEKFDAFVPALRQAKSASGMTLEQIADETGVSNSVITKLFSGNAANPTLTAVAPVCKLLGVSLDSLFGLSHPDGSYSELQNELDYCKRTLADRDKQIKQARRLQYFLFAFALLVLAILAYIICDALHPAWGLFRY